MQKEKYGNCQLCQREKNLTFHHLIPRKLHRKKFFLKLFTKSYMQTHGLNLCRKCHSTLHQFYDEKTLGLEYNTLEKLQKDEKINRYLAWVVKTR
ncbi:MAG: hypothetical protein JJT94_12995 [Bernardetiaceae bacterium]|nr:hypothetical protein [Bernardetiaceae bacterium]